MRSFLEFVKEADVINEIFGQMARKLYGHGGKSFIIGSVESPSLLVEKKKKKKRRKGKKHNRP